MGHVALALVAIAAVFAGCLLDRDGGFPDQLSGSATGPQGSGGNIGGNFSSAGGTTTQGGNGAGGVEGCPTGFACAPQPPADWSAYARISMAGFPVANPETCPDGSAPMATFSSPTDAAATCEICQCDAPLNAQCGYPTVSLHNNETACMGMVDQTGSAQNGNCVDIFNSIENADASAQITTAASLNDAGSCTAKGGMPTLPPAWENQHDVCPMEVAAGASCGAGTVCAAEGSGAYTGPLCVAREGDHACPEGFTDRRIVSSGLNESRGCTACECDGPQGVTCSAGTVTVFDDDNCMSATTHSIVDDLTCNDISPLFAADPSSEGSFNKARGTPLGGMCNPTGGQPMGAATPTDEWTVCCL